MTTSASSVYWWASDATWTVPGAGETPPQPLNDVTQNASDEDRVFAVGFTAANGTEIVTEIP